RANASFRSGISGAYCAWTSTCGIATAGHGRRPPPHQQPVSNAGHEQHGDAVVDEPEVVVELLPARAERPACSGEGEAPDGVPDRGEDGVARKRRLEQAGGYRHE